MRFLYLVMALGGMTVSTAWAGNGPAATSASPAHAATTALPQVRQRVAKDQAEIKQLKQAVGQQESDSQRASERLQEQDQAIAELQKQLQELQARPTADHP